MDHLILERIKEIERLVKAAKIDAHGAFRMPGSSAEQDARSNEHMLQLASTLDLIQGKVAEILMMIGKSPLQQALASHRLAVSRKDH